MIMNTSIYAVFNNKTHRETTKEATTIQSIILNDRFMNIEKADMIGVIGA